MGKRDGSDDAHSALLSSNAGQVVVAAIIFVGSIWIIGPNLPSGPARETVDAVWSPATNSGMEQSWDVFSPNPRAQTIEVVAVLEYDDGTVAAWTVPEFDPVFGSLRSYRWRKWQERIRLDSNERYWDSSAAWIAEHNQLDGRTPNTVRLVRRWTDLAPLTADGIAVNSENQYEFYVWTA